ncbi:hypothetical protein LSTR_LSTR002538 [Laodelphax striatellus]|uniref:Uncharacterized protein n=1 Tax=Laodelphax striatellus TaxID=195883 RepID=A0A482XKR2_LAOST|nr:hypothetical protein LSTR_LSTR002538 [Laodelphax striatellus]
MPEKEVIFNAMPPPPGVGLPLQFPPSAFAAFHHAPLPVDQRTHEGRYLWDPASGRILHPDAAPTAFHHPAAHGQIVISYSSLVFKLDLLPWTSVERFPAHSLMYAIFNDVYTLSQNRLADAVCEETFM